jgi:hypothetical protein
MILGGHPNNQFSSQASIGTGDSTLTAAILDLVETTTQESATKVRAGTRRRIMDHRRRLESPLGEGTLI